MRRFEVVKTPCNHSGQDIRLLTNSWRDKKSRFTVYNQNHQRRRRRRPPVQDQTCGAGFDGDPLSQESKSSSDCSCDVSLDTVGKRTKSYIFSLKFDFCCVEAAFFLLHLFPEFVCFSLCIVSVFAARFCCCKCFWIAVVSEVAASFSSCKCFRWLQSVWPRQPPQSEAWRGQTLL